MARQEPYTCGRCELGPPLVRCKKCRKKRAERKRDLRAQKRADHICEDCTDPAERASDGSFYTRCKVHREANNVASLASHLRASTSR